MATARDICSDALIELGVVGAASAMQAADAEVALSKLNRLLDNWNAERAAVYASAFASFTLTAALSPHTIGPTGATWTVTQRPVSIEAASLIWTASTPNVFTGLTIRDAQWWEAQSVPALSTSIPTDLYYQPDWPLGKLYFWPVPTTTYQVQLQTRVLLTELALASTFTLPPGYRDAITLTLAEMLAGPFGRPAPQSLPHDAAMARARVFANNDVTPRLVTRDAGLPGGRGGYLNWRSGMSF